MNELQRRAARQRQMGQGTFGDNILNTQYNLYDTYTVGTGITKYEYFTVPQGQQGKTIADTNFRTVSQIPTKQKIWVTHVGLEILYTETISNAILSEIYNYVYNTVFEFYIENKAAINQLPGSSILGSSLLLNAYDTTNFEDIQTLQPMVPGYYRVANSKSDAIVLQQQTIIRVEATLPTPSANLVDKLKMRYIMKGRLERTV